MSRYDPLLGTATRKTEGEGERIGKGVHPKGEAREHDDLLSSTHSTSELRASV